MKNNLCQNVRKIRELKGFTQEYLASKLGISQRAYSKIESSETRIDWGKILKIADVLNISPNDLILFDDNHIFNSSNQSLKSEATINNIPDKLIDQFENRIKQLESEIEFLKDLIKRD